MIKSWDRKAPEGFKFTLKAWRRITHFKKLKGVEEDLATFFERIEPLKKKSGAVLYQLPPSLKSDLPLLEEFLKILPKGLDQVIEFRDRSWFNEKTFSLLGKYNVAYCIVSMPGLPELFELTTGFLYIRFHGRENLYSSLYSDKELNQWVRKIHCGLVGKNIKRLYAYFNNDYNAYAVKNALRFRELLTGS